VDLRGRTTWASTGDGRGHRSTVAAALTLLTAGIALALPGLAVASEPGAQATDPAAGSSSVPDPAASGGTTTDPSASTGTDPAGTTATPTSDTSGSTTTEPVQTTPADPAPAPAPEPATSTPAPTATTGGEPVACTPTPATGGSGQAPSATCPALVLVETESPAPAPAPQPPASQPTPAPQPAEPVLVQQPEPVVTQVPAEPSGPPPVLQPLHGAASAPTSTVTERVTKSVVVLEETAAPVLAADDAAPVLAAEPATPAADAAVPRLETTGALSIVHRAPAPQISRADLPPLLEHELEAAAIAHPSSPDTESEPGGAALASTGGDEPLPLFPPQDPSESPTGLGAPSSGGGPQGATGVVAILTAFLLLFVPRIVRRLRPAGALAPVVGYRLVLERPG
jgi:hypothetical protein